MSQTLGLTEAVRQIATTFDRLGSSGRHASDAYFFVVGAGVSTPQVKLASVIERECRIAAMDEQPWSPDPAASPMERYSQALQRAYPNRIERQLYFRRMIEQRAISAANFRIAHLITSGRAPRLVVTTNFDDFLTRALTLFGAQPIVSDLPESAVRIDPDADDIQVLHVHGTYRFYDCCNLAGEISARAEFADPYRNVSWKLGTILEHRSPIVIGYSGWEHDVLMQSLRSRLATPGGLPYNLFWFCYQRDAAGELPDFLVEHDDVVIVVPDEEPAPGEVDPDGGLDSIGPEDTRDRTDEALQEPRLEAVAVVDELNRALAIDEPALTRNPIGFFADHLRQSLVSEPDEQSERDAAPGADDDVYRLEWTIEQLSSMRALWGRRKQAGESQAGKLQIALIQSALRRSQYQEALDTALEIAVDELSSSQLVELREALTLVAPRMSPDAEREIKAHELVIRAGELTIERDPKHKQGAEHDIAIALMSKGVAQFRVDRFKDAVRTYDSVIRRFATHPDVEVQQVVARTLGNRGLALERLGDDRQAIASYSELIDGFIDDPAREQQRRVARALLAKGIAQSRLGLRNDAVDTYADLIGSFGDSDDKRIRLEVTAARNNRGWQLSVLRRVDEAIDEYDQMIGGFRDDDDLMIQARVTRALIRKAALQVRRGDVDEAIVTYTDLIDTYEPRPFLGSAVQKRVDQARLQRAVLLAKRGERDAAVAEFDRLILDASFSSDEETARLGERARRERDKLLKEG